MAVSKEEIKKLSILARLGISEKEINSLRTDLDKILDFVSGLKSASAAEAPLEGFVGNVLRDDKEGHAAGEYSAALMEQATEKEKGYIKVKKVLPDGRQGFDD